MSKKTKKIREYFETPEPKYSVKSLIAGLVLIFVGINAGEAALIFILIGSGISLTSTIKYIKYKNRYNARPSDKQMDRWLEEDFNKIIDIDALDKLGLDNDELVKDSLVIPGPIFWEVAGVSIQG